MVNVMLVDFRGFDTFGEIMVLGIVALTVYALLRRFRPAHEAMDLPAQQRNLPADLQTDLINPRHATDTAVGYLMVPAVLVRLLLPFAAVVAVHLFMRGHNEPGGGFVAGLVMSSALLLQYIVSGTQWVEAHMPLSPRRWIAFGLLVRTGHGPGRARPGLPFPHHPHRPPAPAAGGRDPCGQRHVLRHRRVCARGGLHPADPDGPCPPVGARPPPPCRLAEEAAAREAPAPEEAL